MQEEKTFNRWLIVLSAMVIQSNLGAVYIYSVYKPGLQQVFPEWSVTDLALPSQILMVTFALGYLVGGKLQDKYGARMISSLGGLLLGSGMVLASFSQNLITFILAFGVLTGFGIGCAQVGLLATSLKWFPDKRGLVSGLVAAGFGIGSLIFTPIAKKMIFTITVMPTFRYLGFAFMVLIVLAAQLLKSAPEGYLPHGWIPPHETKSNQPTAKKEFLWTEMIRTSKFWILLFAYTIGATSGLLIIMNAVNIWQSTALLQAIQNSPVISKDTFSLIVDQGAIIVMATSIVNSLSRIICGKISDNVGRKPTFVFLFFSCGVLLLVLTRINSFAAFLSITCGIAVCFGGFLSLFPATTADLFGSKNLGTNYSLVFQGYGMGGFLGSWLGPQLLRIAQQVPYETIQNGTTITKQYAAGTYEISFVICGILCFISAIIIFFTPGLGLMTHAKIKTKECVNTQQTT